MTQKQPKIYLTGVAGMIGSNLATSLLEDGCQVIGIDSLWRGSRKNIDHLDQNANFTFRHADLVSNQNWYLDME